MAHSQDLQPVDIDWKAIMARHAAFEAKSAALMPINKTALFEALAAAGISSVVVNFDGGGDSGQIESIEALAGDTPAELPTDAISMICALPDGSGTETDTKPVGDVIESLAYELLTAAHPGWENNDGAYGEFLFDVAAGSISLEHNDRYVAVESYSHEW